MDTPKRIYDVDVNRAALKKASTLGEFKNSNPHIFDHLGDKEDAAYAELYAETSPTASPKPVAVVSDVKPEQPAKVAP